VRLHALLREAGRACPGDIGLLAVMGTDISARDGLSRLGFDFRAMGRAAVGLLAESKPRTLAFPATLQHGETT
ncbi:MAG TPA: transcriptional regulator, partial [Rariglobus sp.]